jgi:hypothetical protein
MRFFYVSFAGDFQPPPGASRLRDELVFAMLRRRSPGESHT